MTTAAVAIQALKADLGVTWTQLGCLFGVSSRAVFLWAHDGYMSPTNIARLHELIAGELHSQYSRPCEPEELLGALHNRPHGLTTAP